MPGSGENWGARIGRRLKLRDLHILLAVVQSRSMAKAAKQLAISQPAVSQAIAELEHTLGVRLLDRNTQGVEPTAYGDALLKRSLAVFDELAQAVKEIEFLADPTKGQLRIGCPESIAAAFLPTLLEQFSLRYPQIVVHAVQIHNVAPQFRELRERDIDLVLARISKSFAADDLEMEPLIADQLLVGAGVQSMWAHRRKITLADIANEPWVLPPIGTSMNSRVRQAFESNGLDAPRPGIVSLSMHLHCSLIGTGRFLGMLPVSVLRFNAQRFAIKALPIKMPESNAPIAIVTLKNRTLSPIAKIFIEHAHKVTESMESP